MFCAANRGFTIGIGDVTPGSALLTAKRELLKEGYVVLQVLIICGIISHFYFLNYFSSISF